MSSKSTTTTAKKVCKPAIAGETVTSIRKYLQRTRLLWEGRHDNGSNAFDLNADLAAQENRTYHMQQFCMDFVRGNHTKRCNRGRQRVQKSKKNSSEEAS